MSIKPKKTSYRVSLVGLFIFVTAEIVRWVFLPENDIFSPAKFPAYDMALRVVKDIGMAFIFSIVIIEGLKNIRAKEYMFLGIITVLVGVFFPVTQVFSDYQRHEVYSTTVDELITKEKALISKFESKLKNCDLNPDELSELNKSYATLRFIDEGVKISYVAPSGETIQFKPSAKNIEARESLLQSITASNRAGNILSKSFFIWSVVILFSFIIGLAVPAEKETKTAT